MSAANGVTNVPSVLSLSDDQDLRPDWDDHKDGYVSLRSNPRVGIVRTILESINPVNSFGILLGTSDDKPVKSFKVRPNKWITATPLNKTQLKHKSTLENLRGMSPLDCTNMTIDGVDMTGFERDHGDIVALSLALNTIEKAKVLAGVVFGIVPGAFYYETLRNDKLERLKASPEFDTWSRTRKRFIQNGTLRQFLVVDSVLKFMVCPISKVLPSMPIRAGNKTFDFDAVTQWLTDNPGKKYKGCDKTFKPADLKIDFFAFNTMRFRMNVIVDFLLFQNPETAPLQYLDPCFDGIRVISVLVLSFNAPVLDQRARRQKTMLDLALEDELVQYCSEKMLILNRDHGKFMSPPRQTFDQDDRAQALEDEHQSDMRYFGTAKYIELDNSCVSCIKNFFGCELNIDRTVGIIQDDYQDGEDS